MFADYVTGNFWTIYPDSADGWIINRQVDVQPSISTFGEDVSGELYCANLDAGIIYHVAASNFDDVTLTLNPIEIKLYPNPCSQDLTVLIISDESYTNVGYLVTDLNGRILLKDAFDVKAGENAIALNLQEIAGGNYFIILKHPELSWKGSFAVMK